ncbi:hypothetical protein [Winogradskyella sp. 3972H.M.0a.05]|uniref:hypothetical protein n=1 Tax=Winogradskyella sp. 3972H.M.0a.05 TaxID=2950277 RepID=UPI00339A8529
MATHVIWIYATNQRPYPLSIVDDEGHMAVVDDKIRELKTELVNGDIVKWVINTGSNITGIVDIKELKTRILDKDVLLPVFKIPPAPTNDGLGSWAAEVQMPDSYVQAIIEYTITYTVNGKNYTQDPKLQIRKKLNS